MIYSETYNNINYNKTYHINCRKTLTAFKLSMMGQIANKTKFINVVCFFLNV